MESYELEVLSHSTYSPICSQIKHFGFSFIFAVPQLWNCQLLITSLKHAIHYWWSSVMVPIPSCKLNSKIKYFLNAKIYVDTLKGCSITKRVCLRVKILKGQKTIDGDRIEVFICHLTRKLREGGSLFPMGLANQRGRCLCKASRFD